MTVIVIEPPQQVVTTDEAMLHCKVEEPLDRPLVEAYVKAAIGWLDGPSGWLGRSLGVQVLEWRTDQWPCRDARIPCEPLLEFVSVTYVDADGESQVLPIPDGASAWADFIDLPSVRGRGGDVRIRYRSGYATLSEGDDPEWVSALPDAIKVAVLLLVDTWYQNRSAIASAATVQLPFGVDALLSPYRIWSFW